MSESDRFWSKVDKSNGPVHPTLGRCWQWIGTLNEKGYPKFWLGGRHVKAHRLAHEMTGKVIPAGMEPDHLCRNRACVNPDHLEIVTHQENCRRAISYFASKAVCKNGHPFDEENTYLRPAGGRGCRACLREGSARYRDRLRVSV